MEKHYMGAIPSNYDPRDYSVQMPQAAVYPASYMVRDAGIYDQGEIGNCVMQAIRSAPHAATGVEMGATYGYGAWREHDGKGMQPSVACTGFVKDGIPPVSADSQWLEMPEAKAYAQRHAERLLKAASPYVGWTWARLYSVDEIKATLLQEAKRRGLRCIVCLPWCGVTGGYWSVSGPSNGHHEMAIVGWDDGKKAFKLRNSWGTKGSLSIPAGGYLWVKYDDVFAAKDVIALFPPAAPVPEPVPDDGKADDTVVVLRTLRLKTTRMCGDDVKQYQTRINVHGGSLTVDGVFGPASDAACRAFQATQGLTVDGICGAKTWAALNADPEDKPTPEPGDRAKGLVAYGRAHEGDPYVWGGCGQTAISESWIRRMDDAGDPERSIRFWRAQLAAGCTGMAAYDCSGLISKYLMEQGLISGKKNCDGLYAMCRVIGRAELIPGDLLFRTKAGDRYHVGIYAGGGRVIEAKGRDDGVVLRGIDATPGYWTDYGRLKVLEG